MKHLILASRSPRRKQLLEEAGIIFQVKSIGTEEIFPTEMAPEAAPCFIAGGKAQALWQSLSEKEKEASIILSADTVVILEGKILGKPADKSEAFSFLKDLSGKQHKVVTGVCLFNGKNENCFSVTTNVYFRPLSDSQIHFYIDNYKPYDKAGAYAIQEWIGLVGIEKIEGDYYNVVGLPVGKVLEELAQHYPNLFS